MKHKKTKSKSNNHSKVCYYCNLEIKNNNYKYCSNKCKQKFYWQKYKTNDALRREDPVRRNQLRVAGVKHNLKIDRKMRMRLWKEINTGAGNSKVLTEEEYVLYIYLKKHYDDLVVQRKQFIDKSGELHFNIFPMSIDFYIPSKKLVVEYDSRYHKNSIIKTKSKHWLACLRRDRKKETLLLNQGIKILRLDYGGNFDELREKIEFIC